jgi:transposase
VWGTQETRQILAYREPVDLRKSFPGLVGLVKGVLAEDSLLGTVFVFVKVITVPNPDIAGLAAHEYEVIGEKVSYRLAQRPGTYVILKYVRPVIKREGTGALSCPLAPPAVLERSRADVSLLAGLVVDKFGYHLLLYRQHPRLAHAGITLSRATLTPRLWKQHFADKPLRSDLDRLQQ